VHLRRATVDDAEAIRSIYNVEVESSTVTFDLIPRTLADQQKWIVDRSGAHVVIVATSGHDVVGFGSLSPFRSRPAYSTTVEDSVYVHHDHQGEGVGRAVLAELVRLAEVHGFHAVMARIVGGHATSIGLHSSQGFHVVGREREVGRKFGRWLDVVVMERLLGSSRETPSDPIETPRAGA
jgi:phosphinothricin acetyltransferase